MNPLPKLYECLVHGLSEIAGIQYCGVLPTRRDNIELPAILLELVELTPGTAQGTGELECILHWETQVLVSQQQDKTQLWQLVQTVMLWLHQYPFTGMKVSPAMIKQASPNHFSPDYPGHQLWCIEWTQRSLLGDNVWDGEGLIIDTFHVGYPGEPREQLTVSQHDT